MGIPLGQLADARSRRNLLLTGVALWSCMTIPCGPASSYWGLFFARMGVGVGEARLAPCAYSLIADYFQREKRSLPLNIFEGGIMLGTGVANVCGGLVAHLREYSQEEEARWDIQPGADSLFGHATKQAPPLAVIIDGFSI